MSAESPHLPSRPTRVRERLRHKRGGATPLIFALSV